ncbi:protein SFI1 homolog isoform X2 [Pogoniulus pusillus]|uniref:protein SFI1 homolog isoform X2 n=1 Tax=Pogoniulus pusillus TaxID=488313 RepID=UPI0030B9580C
MEQYRGRYLARKFFSLWAEKTFGKVLPSIDRHLLPKLVFKAWRAYVCQQQGKWNKYFIAESDEKQMLLRTWQRWVLYAAVRRTKRGMQQVALAFRGRSCLRTSWAVWRRRHQQSCTGRKMNVLALQHWAQSLQIRAWLQWQELYLHSQKDKQREMRAVTHHRHWQLKRCIEAWLGYLNLQRAKKLQNELAQEHHCSRVARQCFSGRQQSWECRRRMHAHREGVEQRAARTASQRAFARCKHYVVLCVEEARQCELAENHYRHHLLKLGLKGLCQNVASTHLQHMRRNLSCRQRQVTLLQKCWSCWKSRLEEKEEEEQQALTSVACAHYRRLLMRQVFDTWVLKACEQREYQLGEKRAVLHFERRLLCCSWGTWCGRAAAHLEEQEGLLCARDHYSNLLLLKAFCLWRQNTQERTTERLKLMQALRFHNLKCLQQSWDKWREYVGCQREKWRKLVQADMHYQHTLLGRMLAAWKSYQGNIHCILQQAAEQEQQRRRLLLRQLLHTWRENALALIHEAKADEHYRRAVMAKVLLQWRRAALLQAHCQQQKVTAVLEARKRLDIARLQTLFLHWKELTGESLMLRAQLHRAVQHHQQHLLQKYLVKWKRHHHQCLRKVLLQRQGDQLRTRRLCSASFTCWRTRLLQQRWEKQKAVQALWHWSLWLQRKVFDAWLRFAKGQQQEKSHAENTTGAYHPALLRERVTPALRYSTDRERLQGQLQVQHQLKAACSLHHSGDLCAMLWRQKAVTKNFNSCPFLPPLKKQVTFGVPDVSPETREHSAEEKPCSRLPIQLAPWGSALRDPSEAPFHQTAVSRCSAQSGALVRAAQLEESLSGTGSATASCPVLLPAAFTPAPLWASDVHWAGPSPQLWSPSPLLPQMKAGAEVRGGQPVSGLKGAHFQDSQQGSVKWQPNMQPHLLSPEDLLGKWSHQTAAAGEERECGCREAMVLERKLEIELWHIQQQMQYYFSRKQELRSCQQQAEILQKWLEMSMQPGWMFKGLDGVQGAEEELDQLQARISTLSKAQRTERQHVQLLLARLRHIQATLDL